MDYDSKNMFVCAVTSGVDNNICTIGPGASGVKILYGWRDGWEGLFTSALALATWVEDRDRYGRPICSCLHACMLALYGMRVLLPVPIYTFAIRMSRVYVLFSIVLYTCCVTWRMKGKREEGGGCT